MVVPQFPVVDVVPGCAIFVLDNNVLLKSKIYLGFCTFGFVLRKLRSTINNCQQHTEFDIVQCNTATKRQDGRHKVVVFGACCYCNRGAKRGIQPGSPTSRSCVSISFYFTDKSVVYVS